jgi:hypothetical protein
MFMKKFSFVIESSTPPILAHNHGSCQQNQWGETRLILDVYADTESIESHPIDYFNVATRQMAGPLSR